MTRPRSLQWVFLGACLAVVLTTVLFVAFLLQYSQRSQLVDGFRDSVLQQVTLLTELAAEQWRPDMDPEAADALADELGRLTGMRVSLISPNGKVIGDSGVATDRLGRLEDHSTRPEVMDARSVGRGWSLRRSSTLGVDLLYAAGLIGPPASPRLIVRLAVPLASVEEVVDRNRSLVILATGLGVLLSLLISWFVARRLSRPVRELTETALQLARGNLGHRSRLYPSNEIGELARAFDTMAGNLQKQMEAVTRAKGRLEAILKGMGEGVLVLTGSGRVFLTNDALARMFDLGGSGEGRQPSELIRNADLLEALRSVLGGERYAALEMITPDPGALDLEVHIAGLSEEGGGGAVAVFRDVSERKRAERVKRDFVANVSHELRTPLTAIRGSAETLLGGGLNDPGHARRFAEMIERHAVRLQNIVDDLLDLARIESGGAAAVERTPVGVAELVREALASVTALAGERGVDLKMSLTGRDFTFPADRRLMIEALVNLLGNAVKYTEKGGSVGITAKRTGNLVWLSVADTGIGIAPEHISRLFERFYRVDKNRSRSQGGTGLGLAIVKHIAQVHHGTVEVSSQPGRGSTFSLLLPAE